MPIDKDSKIREYFSNIIKFSSLLKSPQNPTEFLTLYDYQSEVLKSDSKKKSLRFPRQSGKSVDLIVLMTYRAVTRPHQSIVIVTPRKSYMDVLFTNFERIVMTSPISSFVTGIRHGNPHRISWKNGSYIIGVIAGDDGSGVQGQRSDLLVADECLHEDTNIYTINGNKKIKDISNKDFVLTVTTTEDINDDDAQSKINIIDNIKYHGSGIAKSVSSFTVTKIRPLHYTPVLNIGYVGKKEFYFVRTETGRTIKITPDHPILTRDKNYKRLAECTEIGLPLLARRLFINDNLKPNNQKNLLLSSIYGVLRSGFLPKDKNEFLSLLENMGFEVPNLYPVMSKDNIPVNDLFQPIKEVPDWVFESKDTAAEYIGGYINNFDKIPDDKYLIKALQHFPEIYIKDGEIDKESIVYFAENIGYRFNKQANILLTIMSEYLRSKSEEPIEEWAGTRIIDNILFEKIVQMTPIGIFDAYTMKTKNKMFTANGFIVHNCDFLTEKAWNKLLPILDSNPDGELVIASTPSGARHFFWKTFNDPSLGFYTKHVKPEEVPHFNKKTLEFFKKVFTPEDYTHEILAEFGELEKGLFNMKAIEYSFINKRYDEMNIKTKGPIIMGIDWNGKGIGVVITIIRKINNEVTLPFIYSEDSVTTKTYNRKTKGGFALLYKEIVFSSNEKPFEDIQSIAVKRIVELQKLYHVNAIYADYGYGSVQMEMLHEIGNARKNNVLLYSYGIPANKGFNIEDPITGEYKKKDAKQLYVSLLRTLVNTGRFYMSMEEDNLNPDSPEYGSKFNMGYELRNYQIKRWTATGHPVYSEDHDHIIASVGFALLGYLIDFDPEFVRRGMKTIWGGPKLNLTIPNRLDFSKTLYNDYINSTNTILKDLNIPLKNKKKKKPNIKMGVFPGSEKIIRRTIENGKSKHRTSDPRSFLRWPK